MDTQKSTAVNADKPLPRISRLPMLETQNLSRGHAWTLLDGDLLRAPAIRLVINTKLNTVTMELWNQEAEESIITLLKKIAANVENRHLRSHANAKIHQIGRVLAAKAATNTKIIVAIGNLFSSFSQSLARLKTSQKKIAVVAVNHLARMIAHMPR